MPNSSQFPAGKVPGGDARVSGRLTALFPPGAVAVEMAGVGDPAWLLPAEVSAVARAVPGRIREFAAGRHCARLALAQLAVPDCAIPAAPDRQPLWPADLVGSITHTEGLCAAVVARRRQLAAVGLDCERVGQVSADIWDSLCTAAEARWVSLQPDGRQERAVALLFSAKEAFYKCQYPLTGEWLDFHDLEITPQEWGLPAGAYEVRATRPLGIDSTVPGPWRGRYLFHESFVSTGIGLACPPGGDGAAGPPLNRPCRPGTP